MNPKQKYQDKAVELSQEYNYLLLEQATGTGKGLSVLRCIESDKTDTTWYVVVPEQLQIENLKIEIEKWGYNWMLGDKIADILCYASFGRLKGITGSLWLNEAHHLSKLKYDIAGTINYKRIIADSATVPDEVRERLYSLGDFYTYKISLSQAISDGAVPQPKIHIIYTKPEDTIKRNLVGPKGKQWLVTDKGYIKSLDDNITYLRKKQKELLKEGKDASWIGNKIIRIGNIRKAFTAKTKTGDVKKVIENDLRGKRFLCFTGSIEQCDKISKDFGVHSKHTKKHNLEVLEDFNSGKIDQIYTNKMMVEGQNLNNIDACIITQLSSGRDSGLSLIQKMGRGLRAKEPEIFILVAKGTRDEDFLNNALLHIENQYIVYEQEKEKV